MIFYHFFCNKNHFFQSIGCMITDKEQLVFACQQKDQEAMKRLYVELAPSMLGVCMRYTRSRDEAQDLLHDGFIKVYENIGSLKEPMALESWVYHVMVNVALDYLKSSAQLVCCDENDLEGFAPESDNESLDFDMMGISVEDVVNAIQSIPEKYSVLFNMREVEDMDYDEIAALLRMPEATVRSGVARARHLIRKKLKINDIDYE